MAQDTSYSRYWGKKGRDGSHHLLIYHCLDVAAVGTALVKADPRLSDVFYQYPLIKSNPRFLPFLLALHDVGKFSKQFQDKIQNNVDNGASHTEPALYLLKDSLLDNGVIHQMLLEKTGDPKEVKMMTSHLQILIESIAGHHGKPVAKDALRGNQSLSDFGRANLSDANRFISEVCTLFLSELTSRRPPKSRQGHCPGLLLVFVLWQTGSRRIHCISRGKRRRVPSPCTGVSHFCVRRRFFPILV